MYTDRRSTMGVNHFESLIPVADNKEVKAEDKTADAVVSDDTSSDDFADTAVWENNKALTENSEGSVQLDVESLVAEFEAEAGDGVDANGRIRRRLEAIAERKRRHEELEDFEDYKID
jgi:hypothetical protein